MAIHDRFLRGGKQDGRNAIDPPRNGVLWTPSDTVDLPFASTYYRVIVAEALKVMYANGKVVTIPATALIAGVQYAGQLKRIYATGSGGGHTSVLVEGPE